MHKIRKSADGILSIAEEIKLFIRKIENISEKEEVELEFRERI